MDISFIIPVYNGAKTIGRTFDSLFSGSHEFTEVIIIDDGSTDRTPELCKQLQEHHGDKVVYVRQDNQGGAAARNHGLRIARGEWLWFLDCDDEIAPGSDAYFKEVISQYESPDVVIGAYEAVNQGGVHTQLPGPLAQDPTQRLIDFLLEKKLRPTHGATVINRRVIDQISYCSAMRQSEDIPVFVRLLLIERVVVTDHRFSIMHRSETSMRNDATYTLENIDILVDEVFKVPNLPEKIMRLRPKYTASRCLSASRILLRAGQKEVARKCFWRGVNVYFPSLFWLKSMRFIARAYLP